MNDLYKALLEVQRNAPALQKGSINPHFGSQYISLEDLMEAILPVLNDHDFLLIQAPTVFGGEPSLETLLIHVPSADELRFTMPLCVDKMNPQGQGSAITYARRYSLMSLLGLVADKDDDGNAASNTTVKRKVVNRKEDNGSTAVDF